MSRPKPMHLNLNATGRRKRLDGGKVTKSKSKT